MTRSSAREIAFGCIYECMVAREEPEPVLARRLDNPGLPDLLGEDPLFSGELTDADKSYIRDVVTKSYEQGNELFAKLSSFATGWQPNRITAVTRAILILAACEIANRSDVPPSTAINEAVELAKKYDTEKAPQFINGLLGSYLRAQSGSVENK